MLWDKDKQTWHDKLARAPGREDERDGEARGSRADKRVGRRRGRSTALVHRYEDLEPGREHRYDGLEFRTLAPTARCSAPSRRRTMGTSARPSAGSWRAELGEVFCAEEVEPYPR
jgi:hypothetical protein